MFGAAGGRRRRATGLRRVAQARANGRPHGRRRPTRLHGELSKHHSDIQAQLGIGERIRRPIPRSPDTAKRGPPQLAPLPQPTGPALENRVKSPCVKSPHPAGPA
ncbi:hypothetical protein GCM10023405_22020 [Streptomonospora salina]